MYAEKRSFKRVNRNHNRQSNIKATRRVLQEKLQYKEICNCGESSDEIFRGEFKMRHFEKIIGEEFLTPNIENNEYSYQKKYGKNKKFSRKEIADIQGKSTNDKLNVNLDRRFFNNGVAVLVEKKQGQNIKKYKEQLENYIKLEKAIGTRKIVGILYDISTGEFFSITHQNETSFQNMAYYEGLFEIKVKKEDVYVCVQSINKKLHKLGLSNLVQRMMFTGLALVGLRIAKENKETISTNSFEDMKLSLSRIIKEKIPTFSKHQNSKLFLLSEEFKKISLNESNKDDVKEIYDDIDKISEWINSYSWDGKDAMAIFFNEFRRYAPKSEHGQVFTPEIWTDLMYKITETNYTNKVLDAACGSGTFLTKTMSKMVRENTQKESSIKKNNIFGIEWAKELYVLACVNMLMHKDGKSNIIQGDSTTKETGDWIKNQSINRVLMNPPFEGQTGIKIVKNVLDNVEDNSTCAFILPDRTFYSKSKKIINGILAKHTIKKIIKMPEKVWAGIAGTTTSIFIFKTGTPHAKKDIIKYWIEEDELITVKNGGRQDVKNRWTDNHEDNLLTYWSDIINNTRDHKTKQKGKELEYLIPKEDIVLTKEDFHKVALDRILFENPEIKDQISEIKDQDWLLWAIKDNIKNGVARK